MANKQVIVYTDGACSGNPGPGGWGAVLLYGDMRKEMAGYVAHTTNNRMELIGPIQALIALKQPCDVEIYSDSAYLINAFEKKWIANWKRNGWLTSQKNPVENQDLWKILLMQIETHNVTWHKVKGHSDNAENNRCDELARQQIKTRGVKI